MKTIILWNVMFAAITLKSVCSKPEGKQINAAPTKKSNHRHLKGTPSQLKVDEKENFNFPIDMSELKTKKTNLCPRFSNAIRKKESTMLKLKQAMTQLAKGKEREAKNADLADSQIAILDIFSRQLQLNEAIIYQTVDWIDLSLAGKFKDYSNMMTTIERRLKSLRDVAFQEEQDYHQLILAEKDINKTRLTNAAAQLHGGVMNDILAEISDAADNLEDELDDNLFEYAVLEQRKLGKSGENIEAVVRLSSADDEIQRLVDANGNQFVLSKGKDSTRPLEDITLLLDLVYIMIGCTVLSYVSMLLGLPVMFGQVICGVVLGPSALNILTSTIQIETLAELGVFFIMFTVGLEFSPSRIRQVLFISVVGSFGMMSIMVLCGLVVSTFLATSTFSESAFIAACFSLSSTPLVVKFTASPNNNTTTKTDDSPTHRSAYKLEYVEILLGILVLQDVQMGMLMATLPALAGRGSILMSAGIIIQVIIALVVVTALSSIIIKLLQYIKAHIISMSSEMQTLASTGLAFAMMWLTFEMGISMELGCFLAGSIISAGGDTLSGRIESLVTPIKDFLSSLFFAAIGLHVFPAFVLVELGVLALATALVVSLKFGASVVVMRLSLPVNSRRYAYIIAAGLSQVSEFSFVLSSRARHLTLISREVYLLILSVSTLSLLLAPFLWRLVLYTEVSNRVRTLSSSAHDLPTSSIS